MAGSWRTSRRELLAGAAGGLAAGALRPVGAGAAAIATDDRPDVVHRGRSLVLAGGGAQIVVAHHARRTLTVTERRSGRTRTVALAGHPLELAVSPHSVLVAVTTAFWEHPGVELVRVRGATHRARLPAGDAPFAPAFTHDRRHLLVTGGEQDGTLRILEAPDFARTRTVALGRVPRGLAVTRDDRAAWIALHAENAVVRVALASGRITRRIETPPLPDRLALSPDGRRLLVSHGGRTASTLSEIDTRTGHLHALPAGDHVSAVAWGPRGQRLAALGKASTILAIDRRGRHRRSPTVTAPRGLAVAGRHAFTVSAITGRVGQGEDVNRRELLARAAQLGAAAAVGPQLTGAADAVAAGERPPNILILMTDQERHRDRLPDDLPVPARCWLDAHGTNLDRFHSSSMACSPARGTLWTGMYAPQQGMYGTFIVGAQFNMDPSIPTIGDLFKELGYRTAFFGKWHLSFPGEVPSSPEQALDTARGNPLHSFGFDDSVISPPSDTGPYNDGYTNDPIWTAQALEWLQAHVHDTQPWFCVLSLLNPHDIQFFPRGFRGDYQRPDYDPKPDPSFFLEHDLRDKPSGQERFRKVVEIISGAPPGSANQEGYVRALLNTYYDLIVGTDDMLQTMIKAVIDAGALDRTVIVRTADHGELGGAHHLQNKGTTMYDEQNRVPFTVVYPKRFPAGARSQALGEQVDLMPTLLEIAGERDPVKRWPWLRGVSLVSALEHPERPGPRGHILYRIDEFAITSTGNEAPTRTHIRAVHEGRYKFARYVAVENGWFAGREFRDAQEYELYDTWEDPFEIRNLANDKGYEALRDDMLAFLYERELAKFGPVTFPAYGPGEPVKAVPVVPDTNTTHGGVPSPWPDTGKPGAYFTVPVRQPTPDTFLYEGGLPSIGGGGGSPQHAADLARFFCELAPRPG